MHNSTGLIRDFHKSPGRGEEGRLVPQDQPRITQARLPRGRGSRRPRPAGLGFGLLRPVDPPHLLGPLSAGPRKQQVGEQRGQVVQSPKGLGWSSCLTPMPHSGHHSGSWFAQVFLGPPSSLGCHWSYVPTLGRKVPLIGLLPLRLMLSRQKEHPGHLTRSCGSAPGSPGDYHTAFASREFSLV